MLRKSVLLKMHLFDHDEIVFNAVDRDHGKSSSLYINAHHVAKWLADDADHSFVERDGDSYVAMRRVNGKILLQLVFLSCSWDRLTGYRVRCYVDPSDIGDVAQEYTIDRNILVHPIGSPAEKATIIVPQSTHRYIGKCVANDKLLRRAFVKALRDHFHYGRDSIITLYEDWNGFYFSEKDGICGGLVPCESTMMGHDGHRHVYVRYGIHT